MALEIIGAGFGRTGTESMKQALELLGFDPCFHMYEVLSDAGRYALWLSILRGEAEPDWDALFHGYRAGVDWPVALYWRELAAHYPGARILLTLRDPESWYGSMEATILKLMRDPENNVMADALRVRVFGDAVHDKARILDAYARNTAEVLATIPVGRLVVHELGDGWHPLCDALALPVPEAPFPNSNASDSFHQRDDDLTSRRRSQGKSRHGP